MALDCSKGSGRAGLLVVAAEKELAAEISLFEASLFRRDQDGMQRHRERAQAVLETILDLKAEQWVLVCKENGIR
ncbi:MAG: hypothetical protein H6877_10180 [Rhodobiaceae bacterium]|nr:hypothetical protein [Rhodobiaceae bacterium]